MLRPSFLICIVAATLVWCIALLGFAHVIRQHSLSSDDNPFVVIAYTAALIAMAGWMFQAWISVQNSRKQHTINVLFQTRMSGEFRKHVDNIQLYYPGLTRITHDDISALADKSVYESVKYVLNYYEFIAVGILQGDLDEALMRDCICSQLCTFCCRSEDVIKKARNEDQSGDADPKRERLLRNLKHLYLHWHGSLTGWPPQLEPAPVRTPI